MKVSLKFIYFLMIFGLVLILGSCGGSEDSEDTNQGYPMDSYYMYTFNNTSGYSVIITIKERYKTEIFGDYKTADYTLYNNYSCVLYTDNNTLNFTWTASNIANNIKILCNTSGSNIYFRSNE